MTSDTGTVNRVLRILSCFTEKEEWDLNELARTLELPRATAHRLLSLCKPLDFVDQNEGGQYVPGIGLYRLAGKLASEMPLHRIALPILENIRDRTDETALLVLLLRSEFKMFFSLSASPSHPMRYAVERHRLQPLSWGAPGRTLLANLSDAEIAEVLRRHEPSPQDGRPLNEAELRSSLAEIKTQGFAVTFGQRSPDAYGIAAPFFGADGSVLGSINITVPAFRFETHRLEDLVALVKEGTARLTRQLGGTSST